MGVASGIFWILVGGAYIWYRSLKEKPDETIVCTVGAIIGIIAIPAFFFFQQFLYDINITVGSIWSLLCLLALIGFGFYSLANMLGENAQAEVRREEWEKKVSSHLTPEDYENHARTHQRSLDVSMKENAWNYWKKEPYYSKVKRDLEFEYWYKNIFLPLKQKEEEEEKAKAQVVTEEEGTQRKAGIFE